MVNDVGGTIAGVMGNVLEWYDFALFGFFSDIIADEFFPPSTGSSALLKSFAIFGGAFLMRPVGGLVIGYIGDKHGRKAALQFSLFLMGIPTFAMGCLPTYEMAGNVSVILLIIMRLLQGMSVGGQLPASLVYTVEKRPKNMWGIYGSLVMMAASFGTLLGNLVGAIMRDTLTDEQLRSFGWRIPFLSGILVALVGLYLKRHGIEHHPNEGVYDRSDSEVKNPIHASFSSPCAILACALTPMLWGAGFYVSFVWMAIYMEALLDPPIPGAFWINFGALFCGLTILIPVSGAVSDKVGRVPIMATGAVLLGVLGPGLLFIISQGDPRGAFLAQTAIGALLSTFGGPICAWLCENFPAEVRLTSASMGYDIAHAVSAGFSPLMATALEEKLGPKGPSIIYPVYAIVSLIGLFIMRCLRGKAVTKDYGEASGHVTGGEETGEAGTELPCVT